MEGVVEQGCFLVCDSDHLALVRVKRHQQLTPPGFKRDLTEGPDNLSGLKR